MVDTMVFKELKYCLKITKRTLLPFFYLCQHHRKAKNKDLGFQITRKRLPVYDQLMLFPLGVH